jgi:hypothetical protein
MVRSATIAAAVTAATAATTATVAAATAATAAAVTAATAATTATVAAATAATAAAAAAATAARIEEERLLGAALPPGVRHFLAGGSYQDYPEHMVEASYWLVEATAAAHLSPKIKRTVHRYCASIAVNVACMSCGMHELWYADPRLHSCWSLHRSYGTRPRFHALAVPSAPPPSHLAWLQNALPLRFNNIFCRAVCADNKPSGAGYCNNTNSRVSCKQQRCRASAFPRWCGTK